MKSSRIYYLITQYAVKNLLTVSLLILILLVTVLPIAAQELTNPDKFENLLPETINNSWKKSSYNSFTSQDEHWGSTSYMGPDNAIIQIGIRHYSADKWNKEKQKTKQESESKNIEGYPLYLGEMMGQREALLFLDNNFSVRFTGPKKIIDTQITTFLDAVSLETILKLTSKEKGKTSPSNSKTQSKLLKKLLPDNLAGMQHGKISQHASAPVVSTTYGNDELSYSVNIQMAKGELANKHKKQLQNEFNEPNTDLEQVVHQGSTLFYREEESAISYMSFYDNSLIIIGADAPVQTSFNKEKAKKHLLKTYEELASNFK
jgi:hypothetical protein